MNQEQFNSCNCESVISITDLCMAFEARLVLDRINLAIPASQTVCLCGINGAGKSTLIRIIAGLLRPTHGMVRLRGLDVKKDTQLTKALIGVISHKSMLYADLTVAENLLFFARLYGVKNRKKRVEQLLEQVSLSPYRHERTAILSRGMLQRLAIARAILHEPPILLADEPFTGLDIQAGAVLVNVLQQFRDAGGTIIMTTHEISFAMKCCDRVVVLDGGRLILDATLDRIDRDRFSKDYLSYARENV